MPRLRTCGSPIVVGRVGERRALVAQQRRRGHVVVRRGRRRSRSCRPSRGCRQSPGMRAMSMSVAGSLSRSFISGTRLWPPASSLALPPAAPSLASASSSDVARCVVECGRESRLASLDDAPQLFGPQHHVDVLHAELAQRVDRRRHDARASSRACRPRRTPLAPSGLTGVGVTVVCSSKRGKSVARGIA